MGLGLDGFSAVRRFSVQEAENKISELHQVKGTGITALSTTAQLSHE